MLIVAVLGWLFDAMDQRLFILTRTPALRELLPGVEPQQLPTYAGWATALFIAGWATGGLGFGWLGDRWGRVRTMSLTILVYSVFTGLSGLARSWPEFAAFRFLCGMGIGGEYAAGVALVAETMPARARPFALGLVQAFSSVGAIIGSGLSLLIGPQSMLGQTAGWRVLFGFGVIPSLLVVLIRMRVKEPDRWLQARELARSGIASESGHFVEAWATDRLRDAIGRRPRHLQGPDIATANLDRNDPGNGRPDRALEYWPVHTGTGSGQPAGPTEE